MSETQTIVINLNNQEKKKEKVNKDKERQKAIYKASMTNLQANIKATFWHFGRFFLHLFKSLFYAMRILGLSLRKRGRKMKQQQPEGQKTNNLI